IVILAPLGFVRVFASDRRRGMLMLLLYLVNAGFAFTYNVGDTHVFYLPSHAILALLVAPGTVLAARLVARPFRRFAIDESIGTRSTAVASILVIAVAAAQAHSNFPALDRSHDQRPTQLLEGLTRGLDDRGALLLADLNWQLVSGLAYFAKV